MPTSVTIVVENTVPRSRGLLGEHGLAMLVERDRDVLLFDTGQGQSTLLHNLTALNVDPATVSTVVLSHGHFDHTGGLLQLAKAASGVTLCAHPDAFKPHYALQETAGGEVHAAVGLPYTKEQLISEGANIMEVPDFAAIADGVYVSGMVARPEGWKVLDEALVVKKGEGFVDDPFHDDMSMVLDTDSGPVLLLGCAHAGLEAIFTHMSNRGGWKTFHAVIGGTHLIAAKSPDDYANAVRLFDKYEVSLVMACHCTGEIAGRYLAQALGDRYLTGHVGRKLTF